VAWGDNDEGQSTVPPGLIAVVQVAAGGYHNLALKSDGTVVAWGSNFQGQCTVPAGLTDVVQIAAGGFHSLALKSDGTVVAWGFNNSGQAIVPPSLGRVTRIIGGDYHSLAIVAAPAVAASRKTHGSAGTFHVDLPLNGTTGIECRSGGATNDHQIIVTYPGDVTVTGNPQAAVSSGMGTVGSGGVSNGGMVTVSGNVVTIPLTNVANAQTVNVALNGVNGSTNIVIPMSILVGDANGNGIVNASDVSLTKSQAGQTVGATNFRSDVNANGTINASDVSLVKSRIGTALP
jgi:hypothetical protein